jgi:hypothetical protein
LVAPLFWKLNGNVSQISIEVGFWYHDISTNFENSTKVNMAYDILKKVVDVHRITSTIGVSSFKDLHNAQLWVTLITFLYVDILDTMEHSMLDHLVSRLKLRGGALNNSFGFFTFQTE